MAGMKVASSEADFEKETPRPEPAAAAASAGTRFHLFAIIGALAGSFCVGATVYFLFSKPVPGVTKMPVDPWMGLGGAVFAALAWFVAKKLAPKLAYRNPGQGRWARLGAYAGLAIIALFGAVALHKLPGLSSKWFAGAEGLWSKSFLGTDFTLRPVFFPAAAFFLVWMVGVHLFLNRPRAEGFLTETQGEMKRVSWPTRR